ncbi:chitin synthase-domain-containing protein [Spinellus fusiger]|nr:chitin synthase-domain-containing protein [Spinellus fusiger]
MSSDISEELLHELSQSSSVQRMLEYENQNENIPDLSAQRKARRIPSMTRTDRHRPRQSMFRTPSQSNMYRSTSRQLREQKKPIPIHLKQKLEEKRQSFIASRVEADEETQTDPDESVLEKTPTSWWAWLAFLLTCCIPSIFIRVCLKKQNKQMQQAWREKLTLVYIILAFCAILAFITYGLNVVLCSSTTLQFPYSVVVNGVRTPAQYDTIRVYGRIYPLSVMKDFFTSKGLTLTDDFANMEISSIFVRDVRTSCSAFPVISNAISSNSCRIISPSGNFTWKTKATGRLLNAKTIIIPVIQGVIITQNNQCISFKDLRQYYHSKVRISFEWEDLRPTYVNGPKNILLLGNSSKKIAMEFFNVNIKIEEAHGVIFFLVLNLTDYFNQNQPIYGDIVDRTLRGAVGNDASYSIMMYPQGRDAYSCLMERYSIGSIEREPGGCIVSRIVSTVILVVVIGLVVVRFSMALLFHWIISPRLVKPGGRSNWLALRSFINNGAMRSNRTPGPYDSYIPATSTARFATSAVSMAPNVAPNTNTAASSTHSDIVQTELYTLLLVTCYSEGEEGLRITMDSLAETEYSTKHKILFVIADGIITGAGETKSTPDIVIGMMDIDPTMANPEPQAYLAVASGEKQLNMAKVYAGHYRGVPCITVVKCGTSEEANGPKPGNRGKRDSQIILMSYFQRILFNDRLCELDYELFWKMTWLMKNVTPDRFELVLMVDADTKVLPDALTYMVTAMANDTTIMGLCGETRIANKRASWVTAIQVFEYYISHHYAKAFESLFGIVTCLPGCFSMYRIKAPKNGAWVPILANPDIILEYNQNVVTTLHEKNLLLLGEDRFLSTLLLRTFPKRQMVFVPQARCKTVVPDEFSVLLSQRRRWINSTVHNLMELVLVSDLCGIACLSMQFSVFVDLIGTLVLPAAIVMTIYLIVDTIVSSHPQWQSLGLFLGVIFLPALLIGITTLKFVYIGWMAIYIVALPIWNFVLPVYSYWHFDDFSWGATRVVVGEKKGSSHGNAEGKFDSSRLIMKKWEDWEAERTGQTQTFVKCKDQIPNLQPMATRLLL